MPDHAPDRDRSPVHDHELADRAGHLPAWRLTDDDALLRTWSFPDAATAAAFARFVAALGEARGKPAVIRQYRGRVTVRLASPQAGGLTELDFELARTLGAVE